MISIGHELEIVKFVMYCKIPCFTLLCAWEVVACVPISVGM